jgi:hypothetical protein
VHELLALAASKLSIAVRDGNRPHMRHRFLDDLVSRSNPPRPQACVRAVTFPAGAV